MSIYPENIIKEVLERLDILQLLRHLNYRLDTVQEFGDSVKAFCPIHKEEVFRTLIVNKQEKTFKCSYSLCPGHKGGDLITFFAHAVQADYDTALAKLVQELNLGIELPRTQEFIERQLEVAENYLELAVVGEEIVEPSMLEEARRGFAKVSEAQADNLRAHEGLLEIYQLRNEKKNITEEQHRILELYLKDEKFEEAVKFAEQILSVDRQDTFALEKLGQAYLNQGEQHTALGHFMNLADLLEMQDDAENALRIYQQIDSFAGELVDVFPYIVNVLASLERREEALQLALKRKTQMMERDDKDRALESLRYALELAPERTELCLEAVELLCQIGLNETSVVEATKLVERLHDHPDLALRALEQMHQAVPRNIYVLERMIELNLEQGNVAEATKKQLALVHIYRERKDLESALALLQHMQQRDPDNPAVLGMQGEILLAQGDRETALSSLRQSIRGFKERGQASESVRIYVHLLELAPDEVALREDYIQTLIDLGRNDEAYQQSLALIRLLEDKQDHPRLVTQIEFTLNLVPENFELQEKLAETLASLGEKSRGREAFFRLYQVLTEVGELADAMNALQRLLKLVPEDVEALWALVELEIQANDLAEATEHLETIATICELNHDLVGTEKALLRLLSLNPEDLSVRKGLVKLYRESGEGEKLRQAIEQLCGRLRKIEDFSELVTYARELMELAPQRKVAYELLYQAYFHLDQQKKAFDVLFKWAELLSEQHNFEKARKVYERVLEVEPGNEEALRRLSRLHFQTGEDDRAFPVAERLIQAMVERDAIFEAIKQLNEFLELRAEHIPFHLRAIELYRQQGEERAMVGQASQLINLYKRQQNFAEVIKWYGQLRSVEPDNLNFRLGLIDALLNSGQREEAIEEYFRLAEWYGERANEEDALQTYLKILELVPRERRALDKIIRLYLAQKEIQKAEPYVYQLAEALLEQEKLQPAQEVLQLLQDAAPENIEVRQRLVQVALRREQTDKALEYHREIIEIHKGHEDYEEAIGAQRRFIQLLPQQLILRRQLAQLLLEAKQTAAAFEELLNLAQVYFEQGRFAEALKTAEELLGHAPGNLAARKFRARVFMELGEEKKALQEFMRITEDLEQQTVTLAEMDLPVRAVGLPIMSENTFSTFVVGTRNHFAYATALAVAKAPAENYNPLFLYADVGLGKTHLLHAIANYVGEHQSQLRIIYTNAEEFTSELIEAIKENRINQFRNKYKSAEALLLDDVHFLAGKERAQEEFFHIFNTLFQAKRQIAVTSDRPPKDIAHLEKRLKSRFGAGVTVDIQPPDYETRLVILKKALEELEDVEVDDELLKIVAERIESNVRDLKAALNQLVAMKTIKGEELTSERVNHIIDRLFYEKV